MAAPGDDRCPNYAAVSARRGFPAKHFFTGDPERGLKMCIGRGPWRPGRVESYLANRPRDFAGCFESLGGSAAQTVLDEWQLHLWNRVVAAWLSRRLAPAGLALELRGARLVTWADYPAALELDAIEVPLPSTFADFQGEWREMAAEVIGAEGTTVEGLVSHDLRSLKLQEGTRRLTAGEPDADPAAWAAHQKARERAQRSARRERGPVGPKRDRR
ncbi:MAG: hypothetical protein ACYTGX_00270 [Planctomycetota bacterium]|jgi:hypothetical protein